MPSEVVEIHAYLPAAEPLQMHKTSRAGVDFVAGESLFSKSLITFD